MRIRVTRLFTDFFESERSSGIMLVVSTLLAMLIANSSLGPGYIEFWHTEVGIDFSWLHLSHSLEHWVNDGLMAIFFLMIGLEIERELYVGELSDIKNATLPIAAAIGGMTVPALLYFLLNNGTPTQSGIGIPMATDIAFALGVLSLLGNAVPVSLKVFLTALAIIDDLGAILMIAFFYVEDFSPVNLLIALAIFAGLLVLSRLGVRRLSFYLIPGAFMWYFMLQSGVHATLAGVLLAFAIPFAPNRDECPSHKLQHALHYPVAFGIMPVFALANTGIRLGQDWANGLLTANSLGILAGLVIGKPLGIFAASFIAVKSKLSELPSDIRWGQLLGAGFLGGIGFTMSIFITLLAFDRPVLIDSAKIAILISSSLAALAGFPILKAMDRPEPSRPA